MNPTPWLTLLRAYFALFLTAAHTALAAEGSTGTAIGRISNAATQVHLEGAVVQAEGTTYSTTTERGGVYRLPLPPGTYTLSVAYTGLDKKTLPVTVTAGGTIEHDIGLTADIYKMSPFTVAGEREGNALAITLQRHSTGIKNIVSADAFGTLASGNPAELLMRMPGIEGESSGGDMRYIRIRGMNQNLQTIMMDGNRIADAASAGSTREVQFQQTGGDTLERIEVTKSPTPDMDADSIGGAVNMISKSAFDRSGGRRVSGSIGAAMRLDSRDEPFRNYSVSYSEVFGGRFGVSLNYGHRATNSLIDNITQQREAVPNTSDGPAYTYSFMIGDNRNKRTRWGGGIKLDYKLSEQTRFYFNTTMNKHDEHGDVATATWASPQSIATVGPNGVLTGAGGIVPGYTEDVSEWRGLPTTTVAVASNAAHKRGDARHYQVGGVQRFEKTDIDYDAYLSTSHANYPGSKVFTIQAAGVGMRVERKDEPFRPVITQTTGPDFTRIESYTTNTYNITRQDGFDEYRGAALNFKRRVETAVPTYLKLGAKYRQQTRDLTANDWTGRYVGRDGVAGVNPANGINDDNLAQFVNPTAENVIHDGRYPKMPYPTFGGRDAPGSSYGYTGFNVDTLLRTNPEQFVQNLAADVQGNLTSDIDFKESISSAYIMGNVQLGKLDITGGLRVERTETEGEGARNAITPEERALRAAYVGALTDAEITRRAIAQFGGRETRTGKYREVFPGVHFRFEPMRRLITRLSYATNIGRPSIGQIVPNTTVNFENRTITSSNPDLMPQYADNFDFSAEYYFEPAGVVSAGVFLKELKQFIFTQGGAIVGTGADNGFNGNYEGYQLTTQYNGGFAKMKGFELNYSQQFTFLPGWMNGFGFFANFTKMDIEGNYSIGNAIALAPTTEVAGFNPETGNAGISYIKNKVSLRLQFNHAGRYLQTFNAIRSRLLYRKAKSTLDIKTLYQINRHFDVYLDVTNVLAEADRSTEFFGGRPQSLLKMFPQFFFGFNGRL